MVFLFNNMQVGFQVCGKLIKLKQTNICNTSILYFKCFFKSWYILECSDYLIVMTFCEISVAFKTALNRKLYVLLQNMVNILLWAVPNVWY